jgi:hypothetical protein
VAGGSSRAWQCAPRWRSGTAVEESCRMGTWWSPSVWAASAEGPARGDTSVKVCIFQLVLVVLLCSLPSSLSLPLHLGCHQARAPRDGRHCRPMLPSLVRHLPPPSPQLPLPVAVSPERHFQLVAFLSSLVTWREQRHSFSFEERGSANVH